MRTEPGRVGDAEMMTSSFKVLDDTTFQGMHSFHHSCDFIHRGFKFWVNLHARCIMKSQLSRMSLSKAGIPTGAWGQQILTQLKRNLRKDDCMSFQ